MPGRMKSRSLFAHTLTSTYTLVGPSPQTTRKMSTSHVPSTVCSGCTGSQLGDNDRFGRRHFEHQGHEEAQELSLMVPFTCENCSPGELSTAVNALILEVNKLRAKCTELSTIVVGMREELDSQVNNRKQADDVLDDLPLKTTGRIHHPDYTMMEGGLFGGAEED